MEWKSIIRDLDEPMRPALGALAAAVLITGCVSSSVDTGAQQSGAPVNGDRPAIGQTSVSGLPAGARLLALDASVPGCVGSSEDRLAVLSVAEAMDFHAVFPFAGETPELQSVGPLEIVVYKDGWPGMLLGKPGVTRERKAGTWDVCVRPGDGSTIDGLPFVAYGDIPAAGSPIKP